MNAGTSSAAVSREDLVAFLRQYGHNTNSFLLSYGGCQWFRSHHPPGLVAYVRSGRTLVVAGDPLCAPEDTLAVFQAFSRNAGRRCRIALLLTSGRMLPHLKQAGYGALGVGADPFFDLEKWAPRGDRAKKVRSAVNLARRSGVTVSLYLPAKGRDQGVERQMDACAKAWLAGRRGFTLRFFSALRPLERANEKRYLLAWHRGLLAGFVTCSPIYARRGWYLEDVIRRPDAVCGTTELLVTSALKALRQEGFSVATTGISPFASLRPDPQHPGRARVLRFISAALTPFYNFRGMQHYKKKFAPSWWEPVYVAFWPDRITLSLVLDVANALIPGGILGLVRGWLKRRTRGLVRPPASALQHTFRLSRLGLYVPIKTRSRFLDPLALGVGLAVIFLLISSVYRAPPGHYPIVAILSKLRLRWVRLLVVPAFSLFVAWRLVAMLARNSEVGQSNV